MGTAGALLFAAPNKADAQFVTVIASALDQETGVRFTDFFNFKPSEATLITTQPTSAAFSVTGTDVSLIWGSQSIFIAGSSTAPVPSQTDAINFTNRDGTSEFDIRALSENNNNPLNFWWTIPQGQGFSNIFDPNNILGLPASSSITPSDAMQLSGFDANGMRLFGDVDFLSVINSPTGYSNALNDSPFGAVPEPATYAALAGLAVLGLACARRRFC